MPTIGPILTIQTASLWASGDDSTFTGSGGPAAFDPFFAEFSDIVNSNGLALYPFQDTVAGVDAGDQVTFVIAIQNFALAAAYALRVRDQVPAGFVYNTGDMMVTDGAGNLLSFTGSLFDTNGLTFSNPVAPFSGTSGANVVLITFTLTATSSVAVPSANVSNSAQILGYAAAEGGANLSGSSTTTLNATTPVQTTAVQVTSTPDQASTTLNAGQTASYDITVTLPEGTTQNLSIAESLPQIGTSWLQLVSAQIIQVGANLSTSLPVMVQPNGSVNLGTVVDTPDNLVTAADTVVIRVTVQGGGSTAGQGTINTTVSATNPNNPNSPFSTTVSNTLTLGTPDIPPTIAGISASQNATSTMQVLPFSTLALTDPDIGQIQTLTIHPSNPALGVLSGLGLAVNMSGDYVLAGPVAAVQAAARALVFSPAAGAVGSETFTLTDNDGVGGVATNANTTITLAAATNPSALAQFPISTSTVLTSTATGSSTFLQTETYVGPINNIQSQFLYDGTAPLAIVAQQNNMLISSQATATAVQLQGGSNVLDIESGSSFLTSGSGSDEFLLHADQATTTWNTIVNFHSGDSIIIYGFTAGVSTEHWDDSAGATGYTGATLRIDTTGSGQVDNSLTFAGLPKSTTELYNMQTGNVGGQNFLAITAN